MPDRPLLLFPIPQTADRSKRPPGFPAVHKPTHSRQGERLSPLFTQLQEAFDARRVEIQQSPAGIDPDQALVIETIGNVENFANAVKKIEDLEWMGEIEIDEIVPDEDFYDESNEKKQLSGRLYFVMSNQRALNEMLSLWKQYQNDQYLKFERGLTKFRDIFLCLKDIRRWSTRDRIDETGILDVWREDLEHNGERGIRFEVELWFRGSDTKRRGATEKLITLINALGGIVLDNCIINDIAYHALLAEIPANAAQQIINNPEVALIKSDEVMFFRPVGQMAVGKRSVEEELLDHEIEKGALPVGEPIVAILDGLPLANHGLLQNRLIIDDPDDHESAYTIQDRVHGTAMASLVVHGDLNDKNTPIPHPVYVRPIMKPILWPGSKSSERVPNDILVVDHIHRAIHRIFEGEGSADAVAPNIRIINFSIGDPDRQFTQILSPLARLLDWLSVKYHVLFVISAGNHIQNIETGMSKNDFDALSNLEKEKLIVNMLYANARNRKILSPGESINGITVGALHHDTAAVTYIGNNVNLFESLLPSPISAFGGGHRRSVKPDLLFSGGRVLYAEPIGTSKDVTFELRDTSRAPGNKVASPSNITGELNKIVHCCGTSNAAALISKMAADCHDTLQEIFDEQASDIELSLYLAPLLKAIVIHGCSWNEIKNRLYTILQPPNSRQTRNLIGRWLGYGVAVPDRVLACTEQRVTLLGFGELSDGKAHLFSLPLPSSLGAQREWRRLTVTLAWMSPISANTQRYRSAELWFEVNSKELAVKRTEVDNYASRRGTVQHEVFEGEKAVAITDDANLTIKVNCRKDAAKIQNPVAYGLAVTLEVKEGINVAIYQEIRTRITSAVEIRTRENH